MSSPLAPLRDRWIRTGDPTDEAAWLEARVNHHALPLERLCLAAYVGHPAAQLVVARQNRSFRRRSGRAGAGAHLRQWIIGLADVCAPEERSVVARRVLAVILHGLGHAHGSRALDELLEGAPPWGLMRLVAGWGQDLLSELGEPARIRRRVQVALAGWALSEGQEARAYERCGWYRVGERVVHPRHGEGFVRRAGKRAWEGEFRGGAKRLAHRR